MKFVTVTSSRKICSGKVNSRTSAGDKNKVIIKCGMAERLRVGGYYNEVLILVQ